MQFQQHLHIRSILRAPHSCLIDHILYYCHVFQPPLNAWNEDPSSLFIRIFGRCSALLLVLSHRGYFTSGFPSQLNPLSWCLACDLSFLEEFSWLLSLIDLGSSFLCKEGFLTKLSSISCAKPKSLNMLSCLFYFHGLAPILWLSWILDIFYFFYCKTIKYHYNS